MLLPLFIKLLIFISEGFLVAVQSKFELLYFFVFSLFLLSLSLFLLSLFLLSFSLSCLKIFVFTVSRRLVIEAEGFNVHVFSLNSSRRFYLRDLSK